MNIHLLKSLHISCSNLNWVCFWPDITINKRIMVNIGNTTESSIYVKVNYEVRGKYIII